MSVGRLHAGPSMMPGGDPKAYARIKKIVEKVSAQVRHARHARPCSARPPFLAHSPPSIVPAPISTLAAAAIAAVASQVDDGPCVTYVGPGGAGNFVKMVHNGIEYGDMQASTRSPHPLPPAAIRATAQRLAPGHGCNLQPAKQTLGLFAGALVAPCLHICWPLGSALLAAAQAAHRH